MAICRALLNYADDDGEPMTPDAVLAMLEQQRAEYLAKHEAARGRQPDDATGGGGRDA
jgi:hypothetical protein